MVKAFTWGTFDYVHDGHIIFLKGIKEFCDELHIIVIPQIEVFKNKGVVSLKDSIRKENLRKLNLAEYIHIDSYNMGLQSLLKLNPDLFVLGYDQDSVWEKKLGSFIIKNGLATKIIRSLKFADGIHSNRLR
jgi:cytidyltransferase-like protein